LDYLTFISLGALVGFIVGISGVGGGSLMTPALLAFGFPINIAVGTDLLYAGFTKTAGAYAHARQKSVEWPVVKLLALGSIPATVLTLICLKLLFSEAQQYESLLTTSLGLMLILTALVLLIRHTGGISLSPVVARLPQLSISRSATTVILGATLGVLVTLSSVGAGAIAAAILLMIYPALRGVQIVGTDIAHAVPITLLAGLGHLILGNVDLTLLFCLLTGSIPAIHLGVKVGRRIPDKVLRPALALLLLGMGTRLAFF
jgi:uncharacterized membrane protein YfcA